MYGSPGQRPDVQLRVLELEREQIARQKNQRPRMFAWEGAPGGIGGFLLMLVDTLAYGISASISIGTLVLAYVIAGGAADMSPARLSAAIGAFVAVLLAVIVAWKFSWLSSHDGTKTRAFLLLTALEAVLLACWIAILSS